MAARRSRDIKRHWGPSFYVIKYRKTIMNIGSSFTTPPTHNCYENQISNTIAGTVDVIQRERDSIIQKCWMRQMMSESPVLHFVVDWESMIRSFDHPEPVTLVVPSWSNVRHTP